MKEYPSRESTIARDIHFVTLAREDLVFFGNLVYYGADVIAKEHPY